MDACCECVCGQRRRTFCNAQRWYWLRTPRFFGCVQVECFRMMKGVVRGCTRVGWLVGFGWRLRSVIPHGRDVHCFQVYVSSMARTYVMMLAELLRRRSLNLTSANNLSSRFEHFGLCNCDEKLKKIILHCQSQWDINQIKLTYKVYILLESLIYTLLEFKNTFVFRRLFQSNNLYT